MAVFKIESGMGDGRSWELDLDTLMIAEGLELRKLTGFSPRAWIDALTDDDPLAVQFAFYVARRRAGEDVAFKDIEVNLFGMVLTVLGSEDGDADETAVPDEVAAVVPTGPATSEPDLTLS